MRARGSHERAGLFVGALVGFALVGGLFGGCGSDDGSGSSPSGTTGGGAGTSNSGGSSSAGASSGGVASGGAEPGATGGQGDDAPPCVGSGTCEGFWLPDGPLPAEVGCVLMAELGCELSYATSCKAQGDCTSESAQASGAACIAAGACEWSGASCTFVDCNAIDDESGCFAKRCVWEETPSGCQGSYDCSEASPDTCSMYSGTCVEQ